MEYVFASCDHFIELRSDRRCSTDPCVVGGLAKVGRQSVVVLAYGEGDETIRPIYAGASCLTSNGFRKVFRLLEMAEKFRYPVLIYSALTLSISRRSRQSPQEALQCIGQIHKMWQLQVPIVFVALGDWTYQGLFSLWVADRVLASRDGCVYLPCRRKEFAMEKLFVKTEGLDCPGIFDLVEPEPFKRTPATTAMMGHALRRHISQVLDTLLLLSPDQLVAEREAKVSRLSDSLENCQGGEIS